MLLGVTAPLTSFPLQTSRSERRFLVLRFDRYASAALCSTDLPFVRAISLSDALACLSRADVCAYARLSPSSLRDAGVKCL